MPHDPSHPQFRKRRALEMGHLESWLSRGPGRARYHLENQEWLGVVLERLLRLAGLWKRANANARSPVLRRVEYLFPDLPPAFHGWTVIHLSDLHLDSLAGLPEALSELLADVHADMAVMTGDYRFAVSGSCHAVYPNMKKVLDALHVREGVFAVLGNHDFGEVLFELEKMGVRMLFNESASVLKGGQTLHVAGVDDPHYYGCDDLDSALGGIPGREFKLLLAHSPELYQEASRAGCHLYLCGHTHAGQWCLPGRVPVMVNAKCPRRMVGGPWLHRGMAGYTHAGVGCSLRPIRFFCPPEAALITLLRDASAGGPAFRVVAGRGTP